MKWLSPAANEPCRQLACDPFTQRRGDQAEGFVEPGGLGPPQARRPRAPAERIGMK